MKEEFQPQMLEEKLTTLKNICLRSKTLTSELLIYGKSLIISPEVSSLPEFLREVTNFTLAGSGIKTNISFDPEIKLVKFDKNLLSIALHNIILNARQAMQDRGTLNIEVEKQKDWVVIAITDTGPGIPEEIKKNLFQPFTTNKPGGSGLGLFTVKRIMEALKGQVEVESLSGKGTTVKLYLPYDQKELEEREFLTERLQEETPSQPTPSIKRVLLMDDEKDIRESLKELLENFNYEVRTCENGEEALEIYQKEGPFEAVILDLTVPGKYNGLQTFRELQKIDPTVRAILATGYAYKSEVLDAEASGFKGVLIKPFTLEKLLELLEKVAS